MKKDILVALVVAVLFGGLVYYYRQTVQLRAVLAETEADLAKFAGQLTDCQTQLDAGNR